MRLELPAVMAEPGPQRFLEDDGATVRAIFGLHDREGIWREIATNSVVSSVADDLSDDDLYIYQFKINPKAAGTGKEFEWHRDFSYWHTEDGLPAPLAFTVAIFLDDVYEDNGPLRLVPGSHTRELLPEEREALDSKRLTDRSAGDWSVLLSNKTSLDISDEGAHELAHDRTIFTACGVAGSVLVFHSNTVHSSSPNRSQRARPVAFITYNPVQNLPTSWPKPRPSYFVNHNPVPLHRH
jgi:ectoine hydroxylase